VPIQTSAVPVPDDVAHYSRDAIRKSRHANWTWVPFWQEHNKLIDGQTRAAGSGGGWKILRASDYYNGMKRKLFKTHKDRWEQGFAALSKFRRRKRHCLPSRHHLEGKFKLGEWVTTQRYLKDGLSVERKRRLDAIGFVWDWRNYRWEQGFAALLKFKHARDTVAYRSNIAKEISDLFNWLHIWLISGDQTRSRLSSGTLQRSGNNLCFMHHRGGDWSGLCFQ
jgi:Helicase associated domain